MDFLGATQLITQLSGGSLQRWFNIVWEVNNFSKQFHSHTCGLSLGRPQAVKSFFENWIALLDIVQKIFEEDRISIFDTDNNVINYKKSFFSNITQKQRKINLKAYLKSFLVKNSPLWELVIFTENHTEIVARQILL